MTSMQTAPRRQGRPLDAAPRAIKSAQCGAFQVTCRRSVRPTRFQPKVGCGNATVSTKSHCQSGRWRVRRNTKRDNETAPVENNILQYAERVGTPHRLARTTAYENETRDIVSRVEDVSTVESAAPAEVGAAPVVRTTDGVSSRSMMKTRPSAVSPVRRGW